MSKNKKLRSIIYNVVCLIELKMVGQTRLELVTPRLSSACSNQLSYRPLFLNGGGNRVRTDDILLAKQALYQLSYTPVRVRLLFHKEDKRLNCALRSAFNT